MSPERQKLQMETYRLRGWAEELHRYAEQRAKKQGLPFSLSVRDILALWQEQDGCCYWFGCPLLRTTRRRHPQQPSLDKLEPARGYVPGNVVLSSLAANLGRNNTKPVDFADFVQTIRDTIPTAASV